MDATSLTNWAALPTPSITSAGAGPEVKPAASVTTPAGLMRRTRRESFSKTTTLPAGSTVTACWLSAAKLANGICASTPIPSAVMLRAKPEATVCSTPAALSSRKARVSASMKPPFGASVTPPSICIRAFGAVPSTKPAPSTREPARVVTAVLVRSSWRSRPRASRKVSRLPRTTMATGVTTAAAPMPSAPEASVALLPASVSTEAAPPPLRTTRRMRGPSPTSTSPFAATAMALGPRKRAVSGAPSARP